MSIKYIIKYMNNNDEKWSSGTKRNSKDNAQFCSDHTGVNHVNKVCCKNKEWDRFRTKVSSLVYSCSSRIHRTEYQMIEF